MILMIYWYIAFIILQMATMILRTYCGFCSNRILLYFPLSVSQLVTGVTSQLFSIIWWFIPCKPYTGCFFYCSCSSQFSVPKWKNDGQPIRVSVPWNSWCTNDPRWLNNVFLFSTEIWAEQLKKAPCIFWMHNQGWPPGPPGSPRPLRPPRPPWLPGSA